AAVVVIALVPLLHADPWVRAADALIGGLVAVALNAVAAPDPLRAARVVTASVLGQLEGVLEQVGRALASADLAAAERALEAMSVPLWRPRSKGGGGARASAAGATPWSSPSSTCPSGWPSWSPPPGGCVGRRPISSAIPTPLPGRYRAWLRQPSNSPRR